MIYSTDIYSPPADPDDYFDLACMYALTEIDLRAIILDNSAADFTQEERPGEIPLRQMERITGRHVPYAVGLRQPMASPTDQALSAPPESLGGVELVLRALRESNEKVTIMTVGSLRDTAVAYNRDPQLFRQKVARLFMFIGNAGDPPQGYYEYNVSLDPAAYIAIMRSGLPVYWVPCFDGPPFTNQRGFASWWTATWEELVRKASPRVMQYFIYAMLQPNADPLNFLADPVDEGQKQQLFAVEQRRNLWCAAIFADIAGRKIVQKGLEYIALSPGAARGFPQRKVFEYFQYDVAIDDQAVTRIGPAPDAKPVMLFRVIDRDNYAAVMTSATRNLLAELE